MASPDAGVYSFPGASQGQTSAPLRPLPGTSGSGCLSGFLLPPLTVLAVGLLLVLFSVGLPIPVGAISSAPTSGLNVSYESTGLAPFFTPEIQFWAGRIHAWADDTALDSNLIATVMQIESCGDPHARSSAGAMGLFQVMPFHFQDADDPYDPDTNALRGLAYLSKSLETANMDARLALAGYNGGIGVIPHSEVTWSSETQRYAYWGSGIYQDAVKGAAQSERLEEWLSSGGASLCRQARQRLGMPE